MSYGWLTESALLPTRAVPIRGVSDASLFSLSNQIFSLQQEQQEQQQQGLCASAAAPTAGAAPTFLCRKTRKPILRRGRSTGGGGDEEEGKESHEKARSSDGEGEEEGSSDKDTIERKAKEDEKRNRRKLLLASREKTIKSGRERPESGIQQSKKLSIFHAQTRKVWKRPSRKPKTQEELLFEEKNARVEERAAKDEVEYKAAQKTIAASRRRLEEKARLYEELISGRLDCSSAPSGARLVVDFEEKLWRKDSGSAPSIKDAPCPIEELEAGRLTGDKLDGNADVLSDYRFLEKQERRQDERQKARRLRIHCLRSRLTSLREAGYRAGVAHAAAGSHHPDGFA